MHGSSHSSTLDLVPGHPKWLIVCWVCFNKFSTRHRLTILVARMTACHKKHVDILVRNRPVTQSQLGGQQGGEAVAGVQLLQSHASQVMWLLHHLCLLKKIVFWVIDWLNIRVIVRVSKSTDSIFLTCWESIANFCSRLLIVVY